MLCALAAALVAVTEAAALAPAGDGAWRWLSPQPQGSWLNAVCSVGPTGFCAVGDNGAIVVSGDRGASWSASPSGTTASLNDVDFVDGERGWAVGGGNNESLYYPVPRCRVILHTDDGGLTWSTQRTGRRPLTDVEFVDERNGWAIGGTTILHTSDGGVHWAPQATGVKGRFFSIAFSDARHGLVGGPLGAVLRTSDGGRTWRRISLFPAAKGDSIIGLVRGRGTTVYALLGDRWDGLFLNERRLLKSTDGGRTWRTLRHGSAMIYSIATSSNGDPWLVEYTWDSLDSAERSAQFKHSADGGRSWIVSRQKCGPMGAIAVGPSGAAAVGWTVAVSPDSVHWTDRISRGRDVAEVDMVTGDAGWGMGWVAGPSGDLVRPVKENEAVVRTSDAGVSWSDVDSTGVDLGIAALDGVDEQRCWVIGQTEADWGPEETDAQPARRTSGRPTARSIRPAVGSALRPERRAAVAAHPTAARGVRRDAADGVDVTSPLLSTADSGSSWQSRDIPGAKLNDVQFLDATNGWVCGSDSGGAAAWSTDDAGVTWSRHALATGAYAYDLGFAGSDVGWVRLNEDFDEDAPGDGTYGCAFLLTTDGGATWALHEVPTSWLTAVAFTDALHGWAIGDEGYEYPDPVVFSTADGGVTWREDPGNEQMNDAWGISFADAQHGRIYGDGIWRTDDGGATWACELYGVPIGSISRVDADHAWASGAGLLTSFDVPGDTAPPIVGDSGDRRWHTLPYGLTIAADDPFGGVALLEYRIDADPVWHALTGPVEFAAPADDHSHDGRHAVWYRATDAAGNTSPVQWAVVGIDTLRPVVEAPCKEAVKQGGYASLTFKVTDLDGVPIAAKVVLRRASTGRVVKRLARPARVNCIDCAVFRCLLRPGRYTFTVTATDGAGNREVSPARNVLVVR